MLKSGWTWAARLVLARPPPPSSSSAGHPAVNVADPVAVGRVRSKGGGSDEDEEVLDRSKLLEWQELKLRSLQAMGEYVAGMAGAFRNLPGVAQQGRGRSGTAGGSGAAAGAEQAAAPPPPPPKFVIRQSKLVSKAEIDAITRRCLEELRDSGTPQRNLENLNAHLAQFPFAKGLATKLGAVAAVAEASSLRSSLLADSFRTPSMVDPSGVAKEVLARLGHVDPLPGRGIRILSIDGGGMKGLTALTLLRRLELETGRRIHEVGLIFKNCYLISGPDPFIVHFFPAAVRLLRGRQHRVHHRGLAGLQEVAGGGGGVPLQRHGCQGVPPDLLWRRNRDRQVPRLLRHQQVRDLDQGDHPAATILLIRPD